MSLIDQIPSTVEWRIYSGDTAAITLIVTDKDDNYIDFTDYTVTSQIREHANQAVADFDMTVVANGSGTIVITIPDTSLLSEIQHFDVQTEHVTTGVVNTIIKGTIIKEQDVTR